MPGKAAMIVRRVLRSAVANATHNYEAVEDNLVVRDLVVDEGFVMKRYRPVSRGMAHPILKRTSHVTVLIEERGEKRTKKARKAKKPDIVDITAVEHLQDQATLPPEEVEDEKKPATPERQPMDEREKAFQKKKMQQLGGDRAKTQRRKSLKEG